MKTLVTTLTLSSLFLSSVVIAGSGHDHGQSHSHEPESTNQMTEPQNTDIAQETTNAEQVQQVEWKDIISITIPAKGEQEYKLQLNNGATLQYLWQTDNGELFFDFHGEPRGDTTGYFKTFEKGTKSSVKGSLTTKFEGTHGWYWKNNDNNPVVITLNLSGEYKRLDVEIDKETANENALDVISSLIKKGKIEKSWASVKASSIAKKVFNGRSEWVVIFNNKDITVSDKQKLYVFLTTTGEYIAANYTGN